MIDRQQAAVDRFPQIATVEVVIRQTILWRAMHAADVAVVLSPAEMRRNRQRNCTESGSVIIEFRQKFHANFQF